MKRQFTNMHLALRAAAAVLLSAALSPAASFAPGEVAAWVQSVGGSVALDTAGRITAVDLTSTPIGDADLSRLAAIPALQRINLSHTLISDAGLERLKPLENVVVLNLYYAEYITDSGIAHLKEWKKLERLNVCGSKVTSALFEHIAAMKSLRSLNVGFSRATDDGFENLAGLENLETFAFAGNKMSGVALPLLKLLPALKNLEVSGWQRTDSGLWGLALSDFNLDSIAQLGQLESLDIGGSKVTDRGVAELAGLTKLHTLGLSETTVTARGLASLVKLPELARLNLWKAEKIDDQAASQLAAMPAIQTLELTETGITDKTLDTLEHVRTLRDVYVGGTAVSEARVAAFRSARPDCRITWWEKPPEPKKKEEKEDPE
jgi:Leucine-rich repeat (LRR) protein